MKSDHIARVVECGDVLSGKYPRSVYEILDTRNKNGREYRLGHHTEGYEIAGSAMRLVEHECWSVAHDIDGTRHARRFINLQRALDAFRE